MGRKRTSTKEEGGSDKTKVIGVRLEPRLRYLAELAARKQRRSLNGFIEWAIEQSLDLVRLSPDLQGPTLGDQASVLWDVDEPDRFAKLALCYPEMLTHDEQVLWKLVRENGYVWKGRYSNRTGRWVWNTDEGSLIFRRLRETWDVFRAVAERRAGPSDLPQWAETERVSSPPPEPKLDDDIPF